MIDPHFWWYVTRASSLIAWVLATLSVVWGILMSTRLLRQAANGGWLQDLHRYFAGTTIVMVALHLVSLMLDGWLAMTPTELFVPFATDYRPLAVALGIIAFYLLIAVQVTSLIMKRLPRALWKGVHFASYAVLVLVAFHAGSAGTDVGSTWYLLVSSTLIVIATVSVLLRVVMRPKPAGPALAPQSGDAETLPPIPFVAPKAIERRTVVVSRLQDEAEGVMGVRLLPLGGGQLAPWHPGSHITLHLPGGLQRQYSLCGDPADRGHFDIAVLRTVDSAGGSQWLHEHLTPGMTLTVDGPLNHFELVACNDYLFVAGGIGITPIKSMIESLPERRSWHLIYLGRTRATTAFLDQLSARYPGRVTFVPSEERGVEFSLPDALRATYATVYCCGPESLMAAVAQFVPADRLHAERFIPVARPSSQSDHETTITLARSSRRVTVSAGASILESLESMGVAVSASCRKGVCGTCEVRVLGGVVEHLDSVLADHEKNNLGVMFPCVSRSATPELVLDL